MVTRGKYCFLLTVIALILLQTGCVNFSSKDEKLPDTVHELQSPAKNLELKVTAGERLSYSVKAFGKPLIDDSELKLEFNGMPPAGEELIVIRQVKLNSIKRWAPPAGKHSVVLDWYNELKLSLQERDDPGRRFDIIFRVYNDGVAFRWVIPEQEGLEEIQLTRELSNFVFHGDYKAWIGLHGDWKGQYEVNYDESELSAIREDMWVGLPLLMKVDEELYAAVTEADLKNWAGMYLCSAPWIPKVLEELPEEKDAPSATDARFRLISRLAGGRIKVKTDVPCQSPWRVIMIARHPGRLIESEIIQNLCGPCQMPAQWIRPGKMAWDRTWSGVGELDMATCRKFIRLASDMGWQYQLVGPGWYGKPGESDCTRYLPAMNIPALARQAKQADVGLWVWLHWNDCKKQYMDAFPLYRRWGIAGVIIDGMSGDNQEMVKWYHRIARIAAANRLMVSYHGSYKPTGLRKIYPNVITREAVLGNEYNKISKTVTPRHNVTIPFTRMLQGPMDFTPGGFLNRSKNQFRVGVPTQVQGTRCHQLAMLVVYDSPVVTICDHPDHYRGVGVEWLKRVPTTWHQTVVLGGEVGRYILVARRSGKNWFLGVMTNSEPREFNIPLGFLGKGRFAATVWKDAADSDKNAEKAVVEKIKVTSKDKLNVHLVSGGGTAVFFSAE